MKRGCLIVVWIVWLLFLAAGACRSEKPNLDRSVLIIHGKVSDPAGNPLEDADIIPYLNGKPYILALRSNGNKGKLSTGWNGLFSAEIVAPAGQIKDGAWAVKVTRSSFRPSQLVPLKVLEQPTGKDGVNSFVASTSISLQRFQGVAFWIALMVFVAVYILIAFEVVHRTLAAFLGATILLLITHTLGHFSKAFKILTYDQAIRSVDWNVVFLLMGMMIIVGVLKTSGVFQWLAYKSFQVARGNIFLLATILCVVTAITSALLDNVTTMLLLTAVTLELSVVLGVSPFVFLLPEIVASNFGGTATLIGDPPNIMIGSYTGLTFNDFILHLAPVVFLVMMAQVLYNRLVYGKEFHKAKIDDIPAKINFLREKYQITDVRILKIGGSVLLGVVCLFALHGLFHMEVSVAALFGAALIILLNKMDIVELLEKEIEWPSLLFFIMLFIVVGAADQTGILQALADGMVTVCQGNLTAAILIILWVSAVASAIVDNIPYTATMLPVVAFLNKSIPGAESGVLWWALALGACFGGSATIIGASANVVTVGIAEKSGYKVTFYEFVRQAAPITVVSLVISTAYLLIRY
jgi:Na+/H+ antiporter NhaD/arsenite permease-like protein